METSLSVGNPITVRGIACRITKLLPLGTVEVESLDKTRHFRVSGLPLGKPLANPIK